jgi:hypothetical protein
MQTVVNSYRGIMIGKILNCDTHFEVPGIIDYKIGLLKSKPAARLMLKQFIDKSLSALKALPESQIEANQWAKIRVAIRHLENLKMRSFH